MNEAGAARRPWLAPGTLLVAVLVDLLPLPDPARAAPVPFVTLVLTLAWTALEPVALGPFAVFAAGLLLDAISGTPLGATPLALLAGRAVLLAMHRVTAGAPFLLLWAAIALSALAAGLTRLVALSIWWNARPDLRPMLIETLLTAAAFPLAAALVLWLSRPAGARRG